MNQPLVHILVAGYPLCNFSNQVPRDWPPGHKWVRQEDREQSTCEACKNAYRELNGPFKGV